VPLRSNAIYLCSLGEQGGWCKQSNFDLVARVPLIVYIPWLPQSHGQSTTAMVEIVDLMPTAIELFGAYSMYLLARYVTLRYVTLRCCVIVVRLCFLFYSYVRSLSLFWCIIEFVLEEEKKKSVSVVFRIEMDDYTVLYYTVLNYLAVCIDTVLCDTAWMVVVPRYWRDAA